jgi:hypothetical protein
MLLLMEEQVMEWTGYSRRADLMRWLDERGYDYQLGRGGRICVKQADLGSMKTTKEFNFGSARKTRT